MSLILKNPRASYLAFFSAVFITLMIAIPEQVHINEVPFNGLLFSMYLPGFLFLCFLPLVIKSEK